MSSAQIQPTVLEFEPSKLKGRSPTVAIATSVLWRATLGWPLLPFYVLLLMHKKERNKIFFESLFSLISPFLRDDSGIFHNYEMQYFLKLSLNTMSGFDHLIYDRCCHALILAYWSGKWFFECEPSFFVLAWLTGSLIIPLIFICKWENSMAMNLNAKRRKRYDLECSHTPVYHSTAGMK